MTVVIPMNSNDAVFSEDGVYRYCLSRRVGDDPLGRRFLWLMLNPSWADVADNDLTVTKTIGFTQRFGGSLLRIANAYALVSTDPDGLETHHDPVGPDNDDWILSMASWADEIICAWGASFPRGGEKRIETVKYLLWESEKPTYCLGLTKAGHPRHPSRLGYATPRIRMEL